MPKIPPIVRTSLSIFRIDINFRRFLNAIIVLLMRKKFEMLVSLSPAKNRSGFSLIELMITVAVIGILAAIALPSYKDYVIRGKIPDATSNLAAKRVQMEQLFQDYHDYKPAGVASACDNDTAISQYFNFSCPTWSSTGYTLQAAGKGTMAGFTYTVDQSNAKATTAVPSGWTSNNSCWVTSKGGTC